MHRSDGRMVSSVSSFPRPVQSDREQRLHLSAEVRASVGEHVDLLGRHSYRPSPPPPTWDCSPGAWALPSGQSSRGSVSSRFEGSWCSPVCRDARRSAWCAGVPCLPDWKALLLKTLTGGLTGKAVWTHLELSWPPAASPLCSRPVASVWPSLSYLLMSPEEKRSDQFFFFNQLVSWLNWQTDDLIHQVLRIGDAKGNKFFLCLDLLLNYYIIIYLYKQ